MKTMNNNIFLDYLDELFPNPKCELNYNKDYELLIAVVLSAQTTDKRVNEVTKILFSKYDTLDKLKNANTDDISAIIRPIGTFNKKSVFVKEIAAYLIDNCNGIVPNSKSELVKMPGVGVKTANVVLSNLYDYPAIAVDTHVSRVSKRMGYAKDSDEVGTIEKKLQKRFPKNRWSRLHHQMVLFGRYRCKSISPMCNDCKIKDICKYNKKKKA
jgi:endonuclease-3